MVAAGERHEDISMRKNIPIRSTHAQNGQAMVEFLIAIVSILALFAALIQIMSIGQAQMATMSEARRQAGRAALVALHTGMGRGRRRGTLHG